MSKRVHVIACGVLAVDLKKVAADAGVDITFQFLPGGLHRTPRELKRRLQEAIDAVSASGSADQIAVGYGVCGLGTVGIHARGIPLAIPRVHDCIALFMGSDAAYRRQFAAFPGTYYIAEGWVEEKARPLAVDDTGEGKSREAPPEEAELLRKYGKENADAIRHFLNSWQRNYQRAAFINTGAEGGKSRYAGIARAMASEFGWRYEEIAGTRDLLLKLLCAAESTAEILIVPPFHTTVYEALGRTLNAAAPADAPRAASGAKAAGRGDRTPRAERSTSGVGLGIDAGGTYTDVAIYDFDRRRVLQKAKALTTKWDHAIGVGNALSKLDPAHLPQVKLVALSTTLATNAIVEGRGQTVGLLLMPPYGLFDGANFKHAPISVLEGKLEIDGTQLAPVNPEQVRAAVREMLDKHRVGAFAVAGYASHVNPSHELQVKAVIREMTALHVTCGHDISEGLNYRVRAETAALNARIIPYLEALLERVQTALRGRGIEAPVMVVRSDGSLMNLEAAKERPVETILSGPAASVAGARYLAEVQNAVVVDVGGTTTDTAIIRAGVARTCEDGATVGGWKTHVRALDMRTLGLGGDSLVGFRDGLLVIGPRRVGPICWLAAQHPGAERALDWMDGQIDRFGHATPGSELIALSGDRPPDDLDEAERQMLEALREGPMCLRELASKLDAIAWQFLPILRLEELHLIQRCGFTPTDVLHVTGQLALWSRAAAERACAFMARLTGLSREDLCGRVHETFVHKLAVELVKKQLDESVPADGMDHSAVAMALVGQALGAADAGLDVRLSLRYPVVGIGAPVHFFLPEAARRLGTQAIIPEHADVANAVGAITSRVVVQRHLRIAVNETGRYTVEGLPDAPSFAGFEEADRFAAQELTKTLQHLARQAGTSEREVSILVHDHVTTVADGGQLFLGRTLEGRVSGLPDLRPADGGLTHGARRRNG